MSALVARGEIPRLLEFPFVAEIELVGRSARGEIRPPGNSGAAPATESGASDHLLDYGLSFEQLTQIGVPAVHDSGNAGQGVMIGVFDNGFRLLQHEAFDSMQIVATYDFVDNKTSVVPLNPSASFGTHGINTLSTIGGYAPGQLIGPAFRASFLLARTENDSSETPLEEDNWVAAIEWADSIGVDVTSTSLVYRDYSPPYSAWTWEDMDGNTTVITRAADMAVAKGIIVVNSAGNYGDAPLGQNSLGAPADGDSVLTVGAVDGAGARALFSSVGPTTANPPRTKPDVMARGVNVRAASGTDPAGYTNGFSGTSAACPLTAGAAALVLAAFPGADPLTIINALKQTASNVASPNNQLGWGIVNAAAAIAYFSTPAGIPPTPVLLQNYPNPFNGTTRIDFSLPGPSHAILEVFDLLGRRTAVLVDGEYSSGWHQAEWGGRNTAGNPVSSGVYILRLLTSSGSFERTAVLIR